MAARASSRAMRGMAAGWGIFTGTHLVMSHPPVREELVRTLGDEKRYLGAFSAVSAATFFPTAFLYLRYARGVGVIPGWTHLTRHNWAVRGLGLAARVAGAVAFGQAVSTPSSADAVEKRRELQEGKATPGAAPEPRGIFRITRHPTFTALALLGAGNMLTRGFAGDMVYWGGWVLIWAVGCPHQDYRLRTTGIIPAEYYEKTSFLPFGAVVSGKQSLQTAFEEFNKPALATALFVPVFFL